MTLEGAHEFDLLRTKNAELRELSATAQRQLATALERPVELEAQVKEQGAPPSRKRRAAEHNRSRKWTQPTLIRIRSRRSRLRHRPDPEM